MKPGVRETIMEPLASTERGEVKILLPSGCRPICDSNDTRM